MITKDQADELKQLTEDIDERYFETLGFIDSLTGQEPAATVPPSRGDTVLVELTYHEEQEYNGSIFYNDNTGRLIAIDQPRIVKPTKQEVIVEIRGGVLAEVYTDDPELVNITLIVWDSGDGAVGFGSTRISDMPRSTREVL